MKAFVPILSSLALAGALGATLTMSAHAADMPHPDKTTTKDTSKTDSDHSFWRYVDKSGEISRPADKTIRREWVHMGTWAIPKVKGASGPGMHDVYTERWVVEAFNKNHKWPDGAVLVKQIHAINKGSRTTGPKVYWAGDTGAWFVMVKDNKNRFPDDKRWAKGWGWALYKADNPNKNVNKDWKAGTLSNCYGCHVPARDTGWVYLEGYPVLDLSDKQKQAAAAR